MRLEKIEINGFKSFAEKTEIILDGDITGIVGPNGSGKSNIADAVRWVLGEQNSRNLRGTRMEDFIFNGTQSRKQKSFCEVSLFFNNEDRRINLDYSEIVISRKMYRSGESEFFLNGTSVRLKDILNVVRDTGIGREGYSIVGQGKIDEILSAKPEARRKVFEEAAGVMRFRARKEEAENKLRRTDENLVRIGDILEELNNQIGPLSEQAEKTRQYQGLYERQKFLDINIFLINHERVGRRLEKLRNDLEELDKEIWQDKNRFGSSVEETEILQNKVSLLEGELSDIRKDYEEKSALQQELNSKNSIFDERITNFQKETERYQALLLECTEKKDKLRLQTEEYEGRLSSLNEEHERNEEEIRKEMLLSRENSDRLQELNEKLSGKRNEHLELLNREHALENSITEVQVRSQGSESEISSLKEETEKLNQEKKTVAENINLLEKEIGKDAEKYQDLTAKRDELSGKEDALTQERRTVFESLARERAALERNQSRADFLVRLQKEYEGYSQGVRNLMGILSKEKDKRAGVKGTLAELIEVPSQYEKAIEQVMGGQLQNIVVESDEVAKRCIALLRDRKLGRVSFMPLANLRVRTLSDKEEALLEKGQVRADRIISCSDEIKTAVEFALGRTVIVDTLDDATALARKASQSFRIVTLSGDIINPGGVITGGSTSDRNFGLVSRTREIENLGKEAEKNQKNIEKLEKELGEKDGLLEKLGSELLSYNGNIRETEILLAQNGQKLSSSKETLGELENRISGIGRRIDEYLRSIDAVEDSRKSSSEELEETRKNLEKVLEEMESISQEISRETESYDRNVLSELQVRAARLAADRERVQEIISDFEVQGRELDLTYEKAEQSIRDIRSGIQDIEKEKQTVLSDYESVRKETGYLRERIEKQEAERIVANERLIAIQKEGNEFQLRQSEMNESRYRLQNQIDRLTLSRDSSEEKILEDYGLTLGNMEEYREQINFTQGSRELQEIRETIRELGPINPNAIEEYNRTYERVTSLTEQKEDLEKAKADLETLITDILSSMRVVFGEKFQSINKYFGEIFTELFGGGKASISLQEGDIMESGIEIFAEPPGKKIQNISALSGGERALTGIALLFAMIRINPAPLCMLDEIDAPLDEANVVRFGNYIQKIQDSQFLIITHRKPTMAICKVLFGVAMEEKGVSKMVSVRIEK